MVSWNRDFTFGAVWAALALCGSVMGRLIVRCNRAPASCDCAEVYFTRSASGLRSGMVQEAQAIFRRPEGCGGTATRFRGTGFHRRAAWNKTSAPPVKGVPPIPARPRATRSARASLPGRVRGRRPSEFLIRFQFWILFRLLVPFPGLILVYQ